jgi:nonsense-mediated mRNA decay protein 3
VNIDNADFSVNESKAAKRMKFKFAEAEVQRDSDIGISDQTYFAYTHLGENLNYDNTVLCYDMLASNIQDDALKILESKFYQ